MGNESIGNFIVNFDLYIVVCCQPNWEYMPCSTVVYLRDL